MTFIFNPHFHHSMGGPEEGKETRRMVRRAREESRENQGELDQLRSQVDRLYLITEAMWFVMKEKLGTDDQRLGELVQDIDQRMDSFGGTGRPPESCPQCARALSIRTGLCMYCGIAPDPS